MRPVREACQPRPEVQQGDLRDAIFAADFGHVVEGDAPEVYLDPEQFFRNTHPAAPLKKIVGTVFERLADPNEAGAVLRLSTGFGGGKSHTLIALWHLARNVSNPLLGTELLPAAGRPKKVAVAGVDGEKAGTAVFHDHGDVVTHSLWGELAYQLGGLASYQKVRDVDRPETAPHAALIRSILPAGTPCLILLDELVIYMGKLSEQGQGALLGFVSSLLSEVGARKQSFLVVTDPAGQAAYQTQSAQLAAAFNAAARRLDDMLARRASDFDPIGDEAAQVIIRRLFHAIDPDAPKTASAEYYNAYQRVSTSHPDLLPADVASKAYAQRIEICYPFHPRLLETAQNRLSILPDFHKSRGTLRLFARILRDVWEQQSDLELISAGDLDWTSDRIQGDLLQRLNRDGFKPAVDEDIRKHAGQLDADFGTDIHRRAASALLLESLPYNANAAMDKRDLTLAILRPSEVGHEAGEALDRLMSVCWHTYPADESRLKYQFRYEANVNKLIEERAESISYEDARAAVRAIAQSYFGGHLFTLVPWPASPKAVSDTRDLKLVLAETEALAQAVCDYQDDSDPDAQWPRSFRNAILGIAPTPSALNDAISEMRRLMAAREIQKEQRNNRQLREQVEEKLPRMQRLAQLQTVRAFNRVVFQGRPSVTLEEKYLVSDESALQAVKGQTQLHQFLDDSKRIYRTSDCLDVDLFLDTVLKGATPSLDHPGAYPANAVHERALASPRLRLFLKEDPIRNTVLKAVAEGKLLVRLPTGEVYDGQGAVCGPEGSRHRQAGRKPLGLTLTADVLLAKPSAECAAAWLKTDEERESKGPDGPDASGPGGPGGPGGVFGPEHLKRLPVTTSDWEEAITYAATRPLQVMKLKADDPTLAKSLIGLAQPLGATTLALSVKVSGHCKDGGMVNFAANDLKPNSPLKPLDVAASLRRATQDGATFEAQLSLGFGGGLKGSAARLAQAQGAAAQGVTLEAQFGPEESQ